MYKKKSLNLEFSVLNVSYNLNCNGNKIIYISMSVDAKYILNKPQKVSEG